MAPSTAQVCGGNPVLRERAFLSEGSGKVSERGWSLASRLGGGPYGPRLGLAQLTSSPHPQVSCHASCGQVGGRTPNHSRASPPDVTEPGPGSSSSRKDPSGPCNPVLADGTHVTLL